MQKALGIVEVSQSLINLIRKMKQSCNGLDKIFIYESAGLNKWKGIRSYDGAAMWDMWPEWIAHAVYMKVLRSLPSEYQPVSFFRVSLRSGSSQRHFSLTIALEEQEHAEIRYGAKILDPDEYSNICFDILVANVLMEAGGSFFPGDDFSDGYWVRQKRAALDRMQRFSKRTYAVKSVKVQKMRINPVHEKDGKWYFWDETWSDRIGPYDSEQEANKKIRDYAHFLETGEVRGEDNGLTERIDVKGGPLPTLPKVEICPECKNTGQVLNFMQYHPCPRGCKKP